MDNEQELNTATVTSTTYRIRTEVTQNTKGYQGESTVEVVWAGDPNLVPMLDGSIVSIDHVLSNLNERAGDAVIKEKARRAALEGLEAA